MVVQSRMKLKPIIIIISCVIISCGNDPEIRMKGMKILHIMVHELKVTHLANPLTGCKELKCKNKTKQLVNLTQTSTCICCLKLAV